MHHVIKLGTSRDVIDPVRNPGFSKKGKVVYFPVEARRIDLELETLLFDDKLEVENIEQKEKIDTVSQERRQCEKRNDIGHQSRISDQKAKEMRMRKKQKLALKRSFEALAELPEEEVADFLNDPEIKDLLDKFNTIATKSSVEAENAFPLPPDNYQPYTPRTDALAHLKTYFSDYLTYFGAEEDRLFQVDLRDFDPKLLKAVDDRLRYLDKGEKIADIIKPLRDKNTKMLKAIPKEQLQEARKVASAINRRDLSELAI